MRKLIPLVIVQYMSVTKVDLLTWHNSFDDCFQFVRLSSSINIYFVEV